MGRETAYCITPFLSYQRKYRKEKPCSILTRIIAMKTAKGLMNIGCVKRKRGLISVFNKFNFFL